MRIIILYFLISINILQAQIFEDFSDGEITTNPIWTGQISDFKVNDEFRLQLNAPSAGKSYISTTVAFPDSFIFEIEFEMKFSPSGSNFLRLYFEMDTNDLLFANGYVLQAGENGNIDALEIYRISDGIKSLIARGKDGAISGSGPFVKLKIIKRDGIYNLFADIDKSGTFVQQMTWDELTNSPEGTQFGIECTYTLTRIDKFYFDNIKVVEYSPDILPPIITEVLITGASNLKLTFNESIKQESIDLTDFEVNNGIGQPLTASLEPTNNSIINLLFDESFIGGLDYTIICKGLTDLSGNEITEILNSFYYIEPAKLNDIKLSEILFNPIGSGSDFVEIYNNSDKIIDLSGLVLGNYFKNEEKLIPNITIEPKSYIAFTENKENLIEVYRPISLETIIEMDLPAFNNDNGNVYISRLGEDWEESFDYDENIHNSLLDDVDGISLERLSVRSNVNDKNNWTSSSSVNNYATPGYKNSNTLDVIINSGFTLENSKFSPNNDGVNDQMRLLYKVKDPGNILNIEIFDSNGFLVKNLVRNQLLGTEGVILWDGTNNSGNALRLGIYILSGNTFDQSGKKTYIKEAISLVDFVK